MKVIPTAIPDVVLVEPQVFGDARGFFLETFHAERYQAAGLPVRAHQHRAAFLNGRGRHPQHALAHRHAIAIHATDRPPARDEGRRRLVDQRREDVDLELAVRRRICRCIRDTARAAAP